MEPPPLSSICSPSSPRSPTRKRRPGVHSARAVARPGSPPVIPDQYTVSIPSSAATTPCLQALHAYQCHLDRQHALTNVVSLILDTGASISVSNCSADFVSPVRPVQHTTLKGIAAGLTIKGIGTVRYCVRDDQGVQRDITIPGVLFVPDCPSRLLCPRQLLTSTGDSSATMAVCAQSVRLSFSGTTITVPYHGRSFLPILYTVPTLACYMSVCKDHQHTSVSPALCKDSSPPLTAAQRVKLHWHRRLNHANFDQVTAWMRAGMLPVPKEVVNAPNPVCAACNYGKAQRRTHRSSTGVIGAAHQSPGAGVSADQLEAGCPGLLPTTKGSPTKQRYHYCNVWVDHYSRLVYVTMHTTKEAKEMLASKLEFEAFCQRHGVTIKSVRADNGVYASQLFRAHCDSSSQHLSLCAVGGHWQNGIAERCIGMVQNAARTILLHAMAHWPTMVTESFWPFAIRHAVNLYNHTTRIGHTASPWELFTGEPSTRQLVDYHVFGSPVYVLHKSLQDSAGSTHKWRSRCWQGIYLGHSPMHAGNVALVYNPLTTHVTPQFHVTWDDSFSSVATSDSGLTDVIINGLLDKTVWMYKDSYAPHSAHHFFVQPDDPSLAPAGVSCMSANLAGIPPTSCQAYKPVRASAAFEQWKRDNGIAADVFAPSPLPKTSTRHSSTTGVMQGSPEGTPAGILHSLASVSSEGVLQDSFQVRVSEGAPSSVSEGAPSNFDFAPAAIHAHPPTTPRDTQSIGSSEGAIPYYAFPATPSGGDTLTQSAMFKAPDQAAFIKAQLSEIEGLHSSGVFSYHKIETLPPRAKLLNAIWSYRRKRTPAGVLQKHKARICTDGSQQQYGVDYWETYAPVVSWSTIRLLLTLASLHEWKSHQVDFAQAFTQPPIEEDIYMRIPQGWYVVDGCLRQHEHPKFRDVAHYIKLEKSLYGIKQAARAWFHFLEPGLLRLGFKASEVDPCLFYRDDCLVALYVDDCLVFSPQQQIIDQVLSSLQTEYQVGSQGSVQDFLGINIHTDAAGATHFTQPNLIDSILTGLKLQDCHKKYTPAISVLHPDHGGHTRCEQWSYRSILGKLNYLAQMTRPDISMAVHNCARFTTAPTYLHEQAIKRIGRYLYATRTRGLIYRPTPTGNLDMYVDADFAGTWHKEYSHLRECVMSRTGFVILYHGCPIHWGSKLQTEIALSTTEAEYIALSTSSRELIPIRRLLRELTLHSPLRHLVPHPPGQLPPSTIYEDNASCIAIATKDNHHKPRTKHISLKYHHFKDYLKSGALHIVKVPSAANLADILTKPLTQVLHDRLRSGMMGW
jgi:hypothetical protein